MTEKDDSGTLIKDIGLYRFPLARPVGTLMLSLGLVIGGLWSVFTMDTDFLPDFSVPRLTVIAACQGLPAKEIRQLLTVPLEESLSSLDGLKNMESLSRDGLAVIRLEFPWGTDRTMAGVETREIIDTAYLALPGEADKPQVLSADPGDFPIIEIGLFPKTGDLSLARSLAEHEIKTRLQRIEGVGSIQVSGGLEDEVQVEVDPSLLTGRGYSMQELADGLAGSNIDYPAGTITEGPVEYLVKTKARSETVRDLEEIYLPETDTTNSYGGKSVQLKNLARVFIGTKDRKSFFMYSTGKKSSPSAEGVRLLLRRQGGFSPKIMADNVKTQLDDIRKSYGKDLEIRLLLDRSAVLDRCFRDLAFSLLLGAIIAFAVLLFFLRTWSEALILLVSLPSSLLWAVLFLNLAGRSLNLMSLGGLALGVGMVVDNSIVVIERLSTTVHKRQCISVRISGIAKQIRRLAPSLGGSTFTTIIVFIPLLVMPGILGSLFGDLALGVILSLAASLVIAVTVIPVLYLAINPAVSGHRNTGHGPSVRLRKLLRKSLRNPALTLLFLSAAGISGFLVLPRLPRELLNPLNEGRIDFQIRMPPGTALKSMKELAEETLSEISQYSYVDDIQLWAGGDTDDPYYLASTEEAAEVLRGRIFFPLELHSSAVAADIMSSLHLQVGSLKILPSENILENLIGIRGGRDWALQDDEPEAVRAKAQELVYTLSDAENDPGFIPGLEPPEPRSIIRLYPDRQALTALGTDLPTLSRQIGQSLSGTIITRILRNGREIDVRLRVRKADRESREDILNLRLPSADTEPLLIKSVVHIAEEEELSCLFRKNRKDLGIIRFPAKPADRQLRILYEAGAIPLNTSAIEDQSIEILKLFIIALVLLYLALGIQFESVLLPLLLMLTIPPGISGIVLALIIKGGSINLGSGMGILVLMGLSVNNGILMFEECSYRLGMPGATRLGSLYRGTVSRLRPVLMTGSTTVFALLPMAIDPLGTSSQSALAVSVIGGLTVSTIISIFLLPHILRLTIRPPDRSLTRTRTR